MKIKQAVPIVLFICVFLLAGCTTTGETVYSPPAPEVPNLMHPKSDAPAGETVYVARPVFEWEPAAYSDGYGVYVSEYNGEDWELIYDSENASNGPLFATSLQAPPELLSDEGQYRWNVRGWNDEAGWGPYSPTAEFTVDLRTDAELHRLVHEHLDRTPSVDAEAIEVDVSNASVTLSGCVPVAEQRETAHDIAHSIGGVKRVVYDDLRQC